MIGSRGRAKFTALIDNKIQEQSTLVDRRYEEFQTRKLRSQNEADLARSFYWCELDSFSCGTAAYVSDPSFNFPLLPQLLVTPHLIVDLIPLPKKEFSRRYGVTPEQMLELTEQGFVIPNIYHFYHDGWRDYAPYRSLWPIVNHKATRINALWISAYLDRRHRFSSIKEKATSFFEAQLSRIKSHESKNIVNALGGATSSLERIPSICGHQLAYLQTLGKNTCGDYVGDIQKMWQTDGSRAEAIRLLGAAQDLTVGALTAAFGGRSHLTRPLYDRAIAVFGRPLPVSASHSPHDILRQLGARQDLLREAEFCVEVANELDGLRLLPGTSHSTSSSLVNAFPLGESNFKDFVKTLNRDRVRSGEWGRWADEMTEYLRGKGQRPDLRAYRDLWREIDSNLKPMPFFSDFLEKISRVSFDLRNMETLGPPSKESVVLQVIFDQLGRGAKCLATNLKGRVLVSLWRTSVPRPLCRQWWRIRYKDKRPQ